MRTTAPRTIPLTPADLEEGWRRTGLSAGMDVIVHASLSRFGHVEGGAGAVVESLRRVLGASGTLVVPTFTWQVTDPEPDHVGVPDARVRERRAAVPTFHAGLPTTSMGAISDAVRALPDSVRGSHPQASLTAVGARAAEIVDRQPLGFALGRTSPFGRLHDLGAAVLLAGVGHDRNTFLHYVETLTPAPRLKVRRFPYVIDGERVWVEAPDVGNDNGRHFPTVGREFEEHAGIEEVRVGSATCRLLPVPALVEFAVPRLTELLAADAATAG